VDRAGLEVHAAILRAGRRAAAWRRGAGEDVLERHEQVGDRARLVGRKAGKHVAERAVDAPGRRLERREARRRERERVAPPLGLLRLAIDPTGGLPEREVLRERQRRLAGREQPLDPACGERRDAGERLGLACGLGDRAAPGLSS